MKRTFIYFEKRGCAAMVATMRAPMREGSALLGVLITVVSALLVSFAFVGCGDVGVHGVSGGGDGAPTEYTCANGTPHSGTPLGSLDIERCASCNEGFVLSGAGCQPDGLGDGDGNGNGNGDRGSAGDVADTPDVLELPDLSIAQSIGALVVAPGYAQRWSATVTNNGSGGASDTTLRYYSSSDSAISSGDVQLGTSAISQLTSGAAESHAIVIRHSNVPASRYLGACVDSVAGETESANNCTSGARVTVEVSASALANSSVAIASGVPANGSLELEGESEYYRIAVDSTGTLAASTSGTLDTYGYLYDSSGTELALVGDGGVGSNFSFSRAVTAGIYYIRVHIGSTGAVTGDYALMVDLN